MVPRTGYVSNEKEEGQDILAYALEGARKLLKDRGMTALYFKGMNSFSGDKPPSSELIKMIKEAGLFQ